jgi:hypothetical protein
MSLDTVCFSLNSLMSNRITAWGVLNRYSANLLHTSVLPTPVGPNIMKDAMGLFSPDSPARCKRMAFATDVSASSCPFT